MVEHLEFVNNYKDLSTDQGFQYEFDCNRCGSGYRTTFKPSITGKISCAPDLGVEMAAAQASQSVQEIWAHAAMSEEDKKLSTEYWREGITATCPNCEKPLASNAKFCPEYGYSLKPKDKCPNCGAKLLPDAKFCAECGQKL